MDKSELLTLKHKLQKIVADCRSVIASIDKEEVKSKVVDNNEELFSKVVDTWNGLLNCNIRLTEKVKSSIRGRLKSFSGEDVLQAVKNRAKYVNSSSWHNEKSNRIHKINLDLVLRNDSELDKWLNYSEAVEVPMFSFKEKELGNNNILD